MKVGDYIRTKWRITKITSLNTYCNLVVETENGDIDKDKIIKSSPNIIDLIELGDLVRLFMEDDADKEDTNTFEVVAIPNDRKTIGVFTGDFEIEFFPIENLRGIVTKEQFSQMEYRLEEK